MRQIAKELNMRLHKIQQPGKSKRLTISLPENELDNINKYAEYYEHIYKEPVRENELIRNMICDYISSDKDFTKWKKKSA